MERSLAPECVLVRYGEQPVKDFCFVRNQSISESGKNRIYFMCLGVWKFHFYSSGRGKEVLEVVTSVGDQLPEAEVNGESMDAMTVGVRQQGQRPWKGAAFSPRESCCGVRRQRDVTPETELPE